MADSDSDDEAPAPFCVIPQRYIVVAIIFLNSVLIYGSRNTMVRTSKYFINIVEMNKTARNTSDTCGHLGDKNDSYTPSKTYPKLYDIDYNSIPIYLGVFFLGYCIAHFAGAIYSDRRSPKHVNAIGIFAYGITNISTPIIVQIGAGHPIVLALVRVVSGLCQGVFMPSINNLLAHWVPFRERSFLTSIAFSGVFIGFILSYLGTDLMVTRTGNWSTPFYVYGGLGLVLGCFWELLIFPNPDKSPFILEHEKLYLQEEMRGVVDHRPKDIPYGAIFTSKNVWALIVVAIGHLWCWSLFTTSLPLYLSKILKYSLTAGNVTSSIAFGSMIIPAIISGYLSDWVLRKQYTNLLTVRKTFFNLGMIGPPVYMLAGTYAGCNRIATQIFFMIGLSFMGFMFIGIFLLPMDLAPNYCGFLTALFNGCGISIGFVLDVAVKGIVMKEGTLMEYRRLFWIALITSILCNLVFIVVGKTNLQLWNMPKEKRNTFRESKMKNP